MLDPQGVCTIALLEKRYTELLKKVQMVYVVYHRIPSTTTLLILKMHEYRNWQTILYLVMASSTITTNLKVTPLYVCKANFFYVRQGLFCPLVIKCKKKKAISFHNKHYKESLTQFQ